MPTWFWIPDEAITSGDGTAIAINLDCVTHVSERESDDDGRPMLKIHTTGAHEVQLHGVSLETFLSLAAKLEGGIHSKG